jgi:hypothetical protein
MLNPTRSSGADQDIMEKELIDRAAAIHERITKLRDSL